MLLDFTPFKGERYVLYLLSLSLLSNVVHSLIKYSIPEEMAEGSVVTNIATLLGLDMSNLAKREMRLDFTSSKAYIDLNKNSGELFIKEKIDREELCGPRDSCFLNLEVIIKNPLKIYSVEIEITDVNDNSPVFPINNIELEISESASPGDRFSLDKATDKDVGKNTVRTYKLSESPHFYIEVQTLDDSSRVADLVLKRAIDREQYPNEHLILTAVDGGVPERSGTASITVRVLDANDNAPQFEQAIYVVNLTENAAVGTVVLHLNAVDLDDGSNAEVVYSFSKHTSEKAREKFILDQTKGEIRVKGEVNYEEINMFEMYVQAKDKGPNPMMGNCKVVIHLIDMNDNHPEISIKSLMSPVQENVAVGTVVALIGVTDVDSGDNGKTDCRISEDLPFTLKKSSDSFYELVVAQPLDRETDPEYEVTLMVTDRGVPSLSSNKTLTLKLLDVNDNPPTFEKPFYTIYVPENNAQGELLSSVVAHDPDLGANGHLTYSMLEKEAINVLVFKYFSVNPDNGNIYALQTFDFEKEKDFFFYVEAKDSGVPPLSGNVSVHIIILDQNDNSPVIVSPWRAQGSVAEELIPRSADQGYLVTKVIALDADSVQNSRITYKFLQVTDSKLFSLDQYNGEVRIMRMFTQRDSFKHKLIILACDNGEPALSSTVTIKLSTLNPVAKAVSSLNEEPLEYDLFSDLNVYLIIGLGSVSFLFLITIFVIIVLKCQKPKPAEEPPPCRNSFPSLRNSVNSQIADSTLISSDAYWYSLFLAETRKGNMVVRQTVPNGAGYIVSSIPRSTGQTEPTDSTTSTLQESSSGFP
nr:PREDICTED: protocadherin alpha-C2-like isoform X1 [Lepisosteus oculatus]